MSALRVSTWKREVLTASRFSAVGLSATLIHGLVAYALLLGVSWPLLFANSTAFLTAVVWSYLGHARWTFKRKQLGWAPFLSFFLASLMVYGVITALILGVQALALPDSLAIAAAIIMGPLTSFLINRFFIFIPR